MIDFIKTPEAAFSFPLLSPGPRLQWLSSRYWMARNSRDRRLKNMAPLRTGQRREPPSALPGPSLLCLRIPKLPPPRVHLPPLLTQDGQGKAAKKLVICHLSVE